jgi:hypothetical protein
MHLTRTAAISLLLLAPQQNGTILLETSSADFHRGEVFQKLYRQLLELRAVFNIATLNDIIAPFVEVHRQMEIDNHSPRRFYRSERFSCFRSDYPEKAGILNVFSVLVQILADSTAFYCGVSRDMGQSITIFA